MPDMKSWRGRGRRPTRVPCVSARRQQIAASMPAAIPSSPCRVVRRRHAPTAAAAQEHSLAAARGRPCGCTGRRDDLLPPAPGPTCGHRRSAPQESTPPSAARGEACSLISATWQRRPIGSSGSGAAMRGTALSFIRRDGQTRCQALVDASDCDGKAAISAAEHMPCCACHGRPPSASASRLARQEPCKPVSLVLDGRLQRCRPYQRHRPST